MENEMEKNELIPEEIPAAEEAEEIVIAPEAEAADEAEELLPEEVSKPEKKKKNTFKIVLISVISTVLVLALAIGLTAGVLIGAGLINFDGAEDSGSSYAVSEKKAPKLAKKVVGEIADSKLTNGELQVYYKSNLINLQSNYGYMLLYYYGVDLSQPVDKLIYDETTGETWQDLILESSISAWHEITAMNMQAREEGFQLTAEQQEYLEGIDAQLQEMAIASGYETLEEMVYSDIGISATEEGFRHYMKESYYYGCYRDSLTEKLTPTQEQIDTYFTENEQALAAEGVTKETCTVDVRHILIQPEGGTPSEDGTTTVYSDEAWEACYQKAQEILDAWKSGEATEDSFAELAKEHSADGNASQGGLYTGVTEGYMVETFNDWIFDKTREYGNVDIVKTQFGYHIMFFVGRQYTWSDHCAQKMLADSMQYAIDTAKNKYPMEIDYDKIVLS